ncbi:MAG: hypothetical protein PHO55_07855 [Thiomonas arsenitoxydans]|nr:hypothetical protein [Thiomonas arsenitoxydans]
MPQSTPRATTNAERAITELLRESQRMGERVKNMEGFTVVRYYETLAAAPAVTNLTLAIIANVRKPGEGAGAGTGALCQYNTGTATWQIVGTYTNATV